MKINNKIKTPDGIGIIKLIEEYNRPGGFKRYGVEFKSGIPIMSGM